MTLPTPGERPPPLSAKPLLCHDCLVGGRIQEAWTIGRARALCVRCAVEHHIDDDMDQRELVQYLYEGLRLRGHPEAY